jgi:hypothetical protein
MRTNGVSRSEPQIVDHSEFRMSIAKCVVRLKDSHDTEHSIRHTFQHSEWRVGRFIAVVITAA